MTRLERGTYIGGHEVSAIAGMNPYMTIADVYANIVHGNTEDIGDKPAVRRGSIIEPGFIDWLEREWSVPLERDVFVRDPEIPYMAGTLDARQTTPDGKRIIHEFTSTTTRTFDLWSQDEPAKYKWIQTQYYMGLDNADSGWIHLLLTDTGEIRHYPIEKKPSAIEALREDVETFWLEHIMQKVPPEIDVAAFPGDLADEMMKRLYPEGDPDLSVLAGPELVNLAFDYVDAREAASKAEDTKKQLAAAIKDKLGASSKAVFDGGYVSWKNTKERTNIDWRSIAHFAMRDLSDEDKARVVHQFTKTVPGNRTLRVQIKKEKQT